MKIQNTNCILVFCEHSDDTKGIICFSGIDDYIVYYKDLLNRFESTYNYKNEPTKYLQNFIMANWGEKEFISDEMMKILNENNFKPKNNTYLNFCVGEEGFFFRDLDSNELDLFFEGLSNLYMMFKAYYEENLNFDVDDDVMLYRYYSKESKLWYTICTDIEEPFYEIQIQRTIHESCR